VLRGATLSAGGKSVQDSNMDEKVEYRGVFIVWRRPPGGGKWIASITAACPSLFPAVSPDQTEAIDGGDRDDMLRKAKRYVDGMLDQRSSALAVCS
jgi:hypothetical protein